MVHKPYTTLSRAFALPHAFLDGIRWRWNVMLQAGSPLLVSALDRYYHDTTCMDMFVCGILCMVHAIGTRCPGDGVAFCWG